MNEKSIEQIKISLEKAKTFAQHILEQCEREGLTVNEVRLLPNELQKAIKEVIERSFESKFFFK